MSTMCLRGCMGAAGLRTTAGQQRRPSLAAILHGKRPALRAPAARSRTVAVQSRYSSSPDVLERVLSAVPYVLPFLDAFAYGRFLFLQVPAVKALVAPTIPLLQLYTNIPFAPLICFFALYLGIVNNSSWSRFVRFNAMQAVLLDILLVLPRLLESLVSPPVRGWGLQAYIQIQNAIWVFIAVSVAYAVVSALLGRTGRIPFVGDAADQQVR